MDVLGSPVRRGVSVGHSFGESGVVGLAECRWVVGICWFDRTGCRIGC